MIPTQCRQAKLDALTALSAAAGGYGSAAVQPHLSTVWLALRAELLAPAAPALLPADLASAQQVSPLECPCLPVLRLSWLLLLCLPVPRLLWLLLLMQHSKWIFWNASMAFARALASAAADAITALMFLALQLLLRCRCAD